MHIRQNGFVLLILGFQAFAAPVFGQDVIYETNFDSLAVGLLPAPPGAANQDFWYYVVRGTDGVSEIQSVIANSGHALHEYASQAADIYVQTFDARSINPAVDVFGMTLVMLTVDFYAHSSDLTTTDFYNAFIKVTGGPHPGYEIIAMGISSGNGALKNERKLDLDFAAFNGVDNNYIFSTAAGRTLEWDTWHTVTIVIDQNSEHYVSITVNGVTEDVSTHPLPRSNDSGVWKRGRLIDAISAGLIANGQSDDNIYWDNVLLSKECSLKADLTGDCIVNLEDLAIMASEWLLGA